MNWLTCSISWVSRTLSLTVAFPSQSVTCFRVVRLLGTFARALAVQHLGRHRFLDLGDEVLVRLLGVEFEAELLLGKVEQFLLLQLRDIDALLVGTFARALAFA